MTHILFSYFSDVLIQLEGLNGLFLHYSLGVLRVKIGMRGNRENHPIFSDVVIEGIGFECFPQI